MRFIALWSGFLKTEVKSIPTTGEITVWHLEAEFCYA